MVPIGRGSSSRDSQKRLLTHAHWAPYRLTPFLTYLALSPTDWLLAAPLPNPLSLSFSLFPSHSSSFINISFSPLSSRPANSHFSPSLAHSPRLSALPLQFPLTHVLLLLLSPLQTWHRTANRSNITLTFLSAVPLPLRGLNVVSLCLFLSSHLKFIEYDSTVTLQKTQLASN